MADDSMRVTVNVSNFMDDPVDIDVSFTVPNKATTDKAMRSDLIGIAGQAANELYTRAFVQPQSEARQYVTLTDEMKKKYVPTDVAGRV